MSFKSILAFNGTQVECIKLYDEINRQDNENDPELMRQFEEAGYIVNVKLDDEDKENKPPNAKREIINLDSDDEDIPPRVPVEEVEQNDFVKS